MTATVQTSIRTHVQGLVDKKKQEQTTTEETPSSEYLLTMDLMTFVNQVMFRTALDVHISPDVSRDEFLTTYETFEKAMMVSFVNLPMNIFAPSSFAARNQLVEWLSEPHTWNTYLQERRAFLTKHDMSMDDLAKDNLLWTWGAVTNFLPTMFWFFYHVATTPEALKAIRAEVDPSLDRDESLSMSDLDNMTALDSAFQEVLRLYLHFMVSRQAMEDMELDLKNGQKYFVKEGEQVVMLTSVLHHDPALFANPTEYQWDRFLKLPPSGNGRPDFRPFGGGAHYCPGRKFATNGAKAFVAHLVQQYDLVIHGTATPDMGREGLGVLHSKTPVQVTLQPRRR